MGLIQKKDQKQDVDGIHVIERSDTPNDLPENEVELVHGESAEDIAAGTTDAEARKAQQDQMVADAKDDALMEGIHDADDDDAADAPASTDSDDHGPISHGGKKKGAGLPAHHGTLFIVAAVVLVIIAGIAGYFVGNGGFGSGSKGTGTATLSKDQLEDTVASWTYDGKTTNLTAKEAIESQYSLDKVKDSDGNYAAPSAETVLSYVRNQILLSEAESRGISVSSKEMETFAENQLGTSDYDTMATNYGVTKDQAKQIVKENATLQKLYNEVVPSSDAQMPTAPTEPADGNTATASKEYADYIIKLAGDEWDSSKGAWKSEDGDYAKALSGEQFTADSATYAQAQKAYYVAYQKYATASQDTSKKWTEFANGLYAKANIQLYGLYQ